MNRIFTSLLIVLIATPMFFSQDRHRDHPVTVTTVEGEQEVPMMTVRGRVFYESTGLPLRRSWIGFVKIKPINVAVADDEIEVTNSWEFENPPSVLTNDFGEFLIKDITPGVYQAVLKVPGILNPTLADKASTLFQQFTFEGTGEAQIEVAVRRGGAVGGSVKYQDGAPLIGGYVRLMKIRSEAEIKESGPEANDEDIVHSTTKTDDRGHYRFAGIPEGEYLVLVMQPSVFDGNSPKISNFNTAAFSAISELKTYFPGSAVREQASVLQIYPGQENENIDVVLAHRDLFEAKGLIVGAADNRLIDGIEIEFTKQGSDQADQSGSEIRKTVTDQQGRWKFVDMAPGKYTAAISEGYARRYYEKETGLKKRPNYATSEHKFEVVVGENKDIVFRVEPEGSVKGSVTTVGNLALPDSISIHADTATKRVNSDAPETTDYDSEPYQQLSSAEFELDDLSKGEYFISVSAGDGYYAKSITYGGKDVMEAPLQINAGDRLEKIRVVLAKGSGTLEGNLVDVPKSAYVQVFLLPVRSDISLFRAFLKAETTYIGRSREFTTALKSGEYYVLLAKITPEPPADLKDDEEKLNDWVRELVKKAVKVSVTEGRKQQIELRLQE